MVPPRLVRRLIIAPSLIAITIVVITATPLFVLIGLVFAHRRHRLLRVFVVAVCWQALECGVLVAALALRAGRLLGLRPEAYEAWHYALCGWFLAHMYGVAARALGLIIEIQEPLDGCPDRPVIVLSRHSGPGDSFLIVHFLLNEYRRRPHIVMKASLQWDPSLDVVLNRLPNAFVADGAARDRAVGEIGRLATGLGSRDAMLIFPEGGNFTPRRRARAIRRLRRQGHREEAERARKLTNVLPPHVAGTLAAIEAAPAADVIFVAHTGVDDLLSPGDVWRRIPMERPMRARWWRVPCEEVPGQDRERWLFDWWQTIDSWIAENRPETPRSPA